MKYIVGVLLLLLLLTSWQAYSWYRRAGDNALRADSIQAAADTTRRVLQETMRDSVAVWQRRAIQLRERSDQLDRALRLERRARVALEARVHALALTDTSPTAVVEDSVRRIAFSGRDPPYTYRADITLREFPTPQYNLALEIQLDPIPLDLRIGCSPPIDGIRQAQATVVSPPWATVELTYVTQDQDVCRSPALELPPVSLGMRMPWWVIPLAVIAGYVAGAKVF